LSRQQAIERIAVVKGQDGHARQMTHLDAEHVEVIGRELFGQEPIEGSGDLQLAEADLDRQLPAARDAKETLVAGVGDGGSRSGRQRCTVFDPPEKRVGIDQ
jgi:hypothetical protein